MGIQLDCDFLDEMIWMGPGEGNQPLLCLLSARYKTAYIFDSPDNLFIGE
jgi:hypothetical protein